MKILRTLALTAALSLGAAGVAAADPGDGLPPSIPPTGPTCYGSVYSYHIWNLIHPMEAYGIDSCTINVMLAHRQAGGTLAQFLAGVAAMKWHAAGGITSVLILLWNVQSDQLRICAAPGRGVDLVMSNMTGQVISCRAQ